MKIAIGSDHAGWIYKEEIKKIITSINHDVIDFGSFSEDPVDYPDIIHPLSASINQHNIDLGFIFCGSGNGVVMTANKYPQVRAALAWNKKIAVLAKQHNNANILGIPSHFVTQFEAIDIIQSFLKSDFEGGRHLNRIKKIPITS